MRNVLGLSTLSLCLVLLVQSLFSQAAGTIHYVSVIPGCAGQTPCYSTIQAAVNAAQAGDTVRIQAGTYNEAVLVQRKNNTTTATEADRIVIEADPATPLGSVVLGTTGLICTAGTSLQIDSSQFITLRGLTLAGAGKQALTLSGKPKHNTGIRIERNRILGNGVCPGGVLIGKGNVDTLLANNLIHGNTTHGLNFKQGVGGPHYVVGNTIHGNGKNGVYIGKGQTIWLVNNSLTDNGTIAKFQKRDGFGIKRKTPAKQPTPQLATLRNNLICGNGGGELNGPLLDATDASNLTPIGAEGSGVTASPGCDNLATVYANRNGTDGQPHTKDDDFTLAASSPAIDRGIDPRTLGFDASLDSLFLADFASAAARPRDGDQNGTNLFDIGALEKAGACEPGAISSCYTGPGGTENVGVCQAGTETCLPGGVFGPCTGQILPGLETPNNGVDEDCNGQDAECSPGATQSCYTGPAGTEGVGVCHTGTETCDEDGIFGACEGEMLPGPETPDNGIDEDCNGEDATSGGGLPPDPGTVAPPIDPTVATTIGAATEFLYTGSNPIQTGVAPGTIDSRRVAVLRGKMLDRNNTPLPGVVVSVLSHPEFGQTLSRADGMFDLAVNGGGLLTVKYEKAGFLSSQRQVNVPWQDFAIVPDVVLVQLDPQVTVMDLTNPVMGVAQGSVVTDADGTRQATLLSPPGTTAELVMPDGSTQPISTLSVRATEYTVGENGPQAMPAALPPNSAYTYAVEYSVDEALAAGAAEVRFNQPLIHYVENFLNFPVGTIVPVGYYDKTKGVWAPSDSGLVVAIVSVTGGLANLDTDGDGTADNDPALGITDEERQRVAGLYPAGQTLWRVPIAHFSAWDCNWAWSFGPSADADYPNQPDPQNRRPDGG